MMSDVLAGPQLTIDTGAKSALLRLKQVGIAIEDFARRHSVKI